MTIVCGCCEDEEFPTYKAFKQHHNKCHPKASVCFTIKREAEEKK
jgi:hypothetical protein